MNDNQGGFVIDVPGLTSEQITEALNATCPECGASCGTHFPKCSLETREPIKIDPTPITVEEICRLRGIPYEPKRMGHLSKNARKILEPVAALVSPWCISTWATLTVLKAMGWL